MIQRHTRTAVSIQLRCIHRSLFATVERLNNGTFMCMFATDTGCQLAHTASSLVKSSKGCVIKTRHSIADFHRGCFVAGWEASSAPSTK